MVMSKIKVGICQLRYGYDIPDNICRATYMVEQAARSGADIAVLPEMFLCPYEPKQIKAACSYSEAATASMKKAAIENGIYIVAGSIPWPSDGQKPYNRATVLDPSGEEIYYHDKIHLFDCDPPGGPKVIESLMIQKGKTFGAFKTPWGMCSALVCYDIRFTPLFQLLANMGVKMLFIPAAFSLSTGPAHWEMLVRMRALELQGFVIGVQPARNNSLAYVPYGHSIIAGPFGEVIKDMGEDESVEVVDVDLEECERLKKRFPLVDHRRTDLYRTVWLDGNRS
jgi:predicted amidohydrolase